MPWNTGNCFGGAFAWTLGMGLRKVAYLVSSVMSIDNSDSTIGLFQHELLHNLGVGHTQKRHGNNSTEKLNTFNFLNKTATNTLLSIGRISRLAVTVSMRLARGLSARLTAPLMTAAASCTTLTEPSDFRAWDPP